jgi:hypothetical protein
MLFCYDFLKLQLFLCLSFSRGGRALQCWTDSEAQPDLEIKDFE